VPSLPTVLLADDSLTIQRVVSLTFADQPVRIVVAKDGQDAINRMTKDRPDLVLADTNMPCVDGYELARWVRQQPHLSAVPVLLLAGVTDPVDEQRLHDSGANGVLEKPFEPNHVISRVKELLGLKGTPPVPNTRLVTTPEMKPARTVPPRAGEAAMPAAQGESPAATSPDAPAPPPKPSSGIFRTADAGPAFPRPSQPEPVSEAALDSSGEVGTEYGARGDARDWFADDPSPGVAERASLADELGVGFHRDFAPVPFERSASPDDMARGGGAPSTPADVFASLLAAEQGDPAAVVIPPAAPELTPELLDQLAARVVAHLRPRAFGDELQRGIAGGLRDSVLQTLRESVVSETRAAVAEAVQTAMNGAILGTVRGAVNDAVSTAVPAAVAQALGPALTPVLQQTLRELVTEAVAAAVPAAILDAVRGEAGGQVSAIVRETAERLVSEEIARIRQRRSP
jgi:CheY-like chemotaxis protein